ncbi:uncharacterized protein LOC115067470 [Nannospalax galili]|uniref:uncharacterized protein LOC115067470 n=1 Tax=Nannospalax galili TaxID=1026970 RepID=UPI00111C33C6|nr:uncharacterized protein LOC115067470 [Nannospalax galili]
MGFQLLLNGGSGAKASPMALPTSFSSGGPCLPFQAPGAQDVKPARDTAGSAPRTPPGGRGRQQPRAPSWERSCQSDACRPEEQLSAAPAQKGAQRCRPAWSGECAAAQPVAQRCPPPAGSIASPPPSRPRRERRATASIRDFGPAVPIRDLGRGALS